MVDVWNMEEYSMIKKGLLFSLVAFASLFVLTACPNKKTEGDGGPKEFIVNRDFVSLTKSGFVPPVIRLGNTYVNDKIESKEKTLSYEYSYLRLNNNDKDFPAKAEAVKQVFADGRVFHTATINERDAGDASKTKLKYEKLKDVNGGEICIGTRFILGLVVKNQVGEEVYKAIVKFSVWAPTSGVLSPSDKTIWVPGDQTAFPITSVSASEGGDIDYEKVKYNDKGYTVYVVKDSIKGKSVHLTFSGFGETNDVIGQ